jgi:glycosyltransferase involved in cell wall biosynthesis
MIRLCLIITGLSTGGAEMMLLKLLQGLDRQRFSPEVISLTNLGDIGPRLQAMAIPVTALEISPGPPEVRSLLALVRHLRQTAPCIVHTWMYHADLLGGLAARLAGVQVLVWGIRQSNLDPAVNKRSTLRVMKACALLSGWVPHSILSCSERARTVHVAAGYCAEKMALIYNGFDLKSFRPDSAARDSVRAELGIAPDTPLVGVVARDDPQKNHLGFIQAATAVQAALPQCCFLLAGQGIDHSNASLSHAIACARLQDHMYLLGNRDDVPRLMAALDVLALPSHGEAFPNVLGEAMACEVPCVVTDVGDSADIVGDTGRVVAAGDMGDMARQLLAVLQMSVEQRRALGASARARVQERYELGNVVRQYEDFYSELLRDN